MNNNSIFMFSLILSHWGPSYLSLSGIKKFLVEHIQIVINADFSMKGGDGKSEEKEVKKCKTRKLNSDHGCTN
ncbi:hypothetical protein Avbf_00725 [Armadillidium vulgare]|nr:hypothetical protein Avbf_00725 [Armadillidium vulgare]